MSRRPAELSRTSARCFRSGVQGASDQVNQGPTGTGILVSMVQSSAVRISPPRKAGLCAFCDQIGLMSEEDLFPMWAGRVMRDLASEKLDVIYSSRQLDADGGTVRHEHQRRQTYSAVKLQGVCEGCNNQWMSDIERAAKPLVERMIRDGRVGLSVYDIGLISRWLTLKTLVADLIPHDAPTFAPEDYHAFHANQNPPEGFAAALGRIDLKGKQTNYYLLQPLTTAIEHEGLPINTPHALCFSVSLGPLWAQTYLPNEKTRTYPLGRLRKSSPYWIRLMPDPTVVIWPPALSFTVDKLPQSLTEFPEAVEWIDKHVRQKMATT